MANIGIVLKDEISRLARKTTKSEVAALRKASTQYRADIADLKRVIKELRRDVDRLKKGVGRSSVKSAQTDTEPDGKSLRFRAAGFASHRQRLGLTLKQAAALIGASSLSISHWEDPENPIKPSSKFMPAIAAFRKMGRREARVRLEELALDT